MLSAAMHAWAKIPSAGLQDAVQFHQPIINHRRPMPGLADTMP